MFELAWLFTVLAAAAYISDSYRSAVSSIIDTLTAAIAASLVFAPVAKLILGFAQWPDVRVRIICCAVLYVFAVFVGWGGLALLLLRGFLRCL